MDLSTIPGLRELWAETAGAPEVCVAVLDGPVEISHPALAGADLSMECRGDSAGTVVSNAIAHGTQVTSIIFGQHDSPVKGIAPRCRGLIIPIFADDADGAIQPVGDDAVADAIQRAVDLGAQVINISAGQLSAPESAGAALKQAVANCRDKVLIVASAGNNGCRCLMIPGALPSVLAVGAMGVDGSPLSFSNWGHVYSNQGILAPGENIITADADGGITTCTGTSFAAPVVSGVAALLFSLVRKLGGTPNPSLIREAILKRAIGCERQTAENCERLLAGRLNIKDSVDYLKGGAISMSSECQADMTKRAVAPSASVEVTNQIAPTACSCGGGGSGPKQHVFAIGRLSYEFESQPREDSIQQMMERVKAIPSEPLVSNPFDLLRHLLGFEEIKVSLARGGIKDVSEHHASGSIQITIRDNDPPLIPDDDYREVAILGMYVRWYGGSSQSSHLNADNQARTRIRRIDERNFYLPEYRWDAMAVHEFEDGNWFVPRECESTYRHRANRNDANSLVWTVNRGETILHALYPEGPFAEEAYDELMDFLLNHLGINRKGLNFYYYEYKGRVHPWPATWDPCYYDRANKQIYQDTDELADTTTTDKSESVAVPGTITGRTQTKLGNTFFKIDPDLRGMAEWSRDHLLKRLEHEIREFQNLRPGQLKKVRGKIHDILDRLDEEVRNSGMASEERALNYAATQHVQVFAEVAKELLKEFELDSVSTYENKHCPAGSDCWNVEISFFNPDNVDVAPIIVRQTVDVSDVVPITVEPTRRFRRRASFVG